MSLLGRFLARVAPIDVGDVTLSAMVQAITGPGELLDTVAREQTGYAAYGQVMDPDVAPSGVLGWLGQFAGVTFLPSDTEAQQRARIKAAAGFYRGTPQAMINEVKPTLTGTQYASVLQQVGSARWAMTLVTLSAETPNAAATYAAALRQKPAGINLTHTVATGALIDQGTRTINAGAATINTAVLADIT